MADRVGDGLTVTPDRHVETDRPTMVEQLQQSLETMAGEVLDRNQRIAGLAAENDRMREALEELDQHASLGTPPWYVVPDHVIEKARAALVVEQSTREPDERA